MQINCRALLVGKSGHAGFFSDAWKWYLPIPFLGASQLMQPD
jgi:hypothetical protein